MLTGRLAMHESTIHQGHQISPCSNPPSTKGTLLSPPLLSKPYAMAATAIIGFPAHQRSPCTNPPSTCPRHFLLSQPYAMAAAVGSLPLSPSLPLSLSLSPSLSLRRCNPLTGGGQPLPLWWQHHIFAPNRSLPLSPSLCPSHANSPISSSLSLALSFSALSRTFAAIEGQMDGGGWRQGGMEGPERRGMGGSRRATTKRAFCKKKQGEGGRSGQRHRHTHRCIKQFSVSKSR